MKKRALLFLVLLASSLTPLGLAQEYPFKLAVDNHQASLTLALFKEQLYRARLSTFYTGESFYNLYYGLKNKAFELSTGHQQLTLAGGLIVNNAQYQDATILAGIHDAINYRVGITPLFSFYEVGINQLLTLSYWDESKQISELIQTASHRSVATIALNYEISDNLSLEAAYAVSNIPKSTSVSQNSGTGIMVGGEYKNLVVWGINNSIALHSYFWEWQQTPSLDPYSADLFNNNIDQQISLLKDQGSKRLTVFQYRGEYQVQNTTLYCNIKTIFNDTQNSAYKVGANYKVPEIAGLGLGASITNMADLFNRKAEPIFMISLVYVGSLNS